MARLGIAVDLGTSGFRAHAVDLADGTICAAAAAAAHPLPGGNLIDHVQFALECGSAAAAQRMVSGVNRLIAALGVQAQDIERLAVCGNPAQLSLFQGLDVRDLAYSGKRKLAALGIGDISRPAAQRSGSEFPGLAVPLDCAVIIPPAVKQEVGADTLALIIKTGMLEHDETSFAIDVGTNAEMVVYHQGMIVTGSAAAGPAIEGAQISCGMLAAAGAISDADLVDGCWQLTVLNDALQPVSAGNSDPCRPDPAGLTAAVRGITGTGIIAVIEQALGHGLLVLPRIATPDRCLHFSETIAVTEEDVRSAGTAIGAIRAGYRTLCHAAGIPPAAVRTAYLAGASGTYVDPLKAVRLGLVPDRVARVFQAGNTSLALARDLVLDPGMLDTLTLLADRLRPAHCAFATSPIFKHVFLLEYSYWTEGMPWQHYSQLLQKYGIPDQPLPERGTPEMYRIGSDSSVVAGIRVLPAPDEQVRQAVPGCTRCRACAAACPGKALSVMDNGQLSLQTERCRGFSCRFCERSCALDVLRIASFFTPNGNGPG
jgi:methylamine methyltransferase corrinoid protein reductive activase